MLTLHKGYIVFDFVKIMQTVEEVKQSLSAIEEMQAQILETLANIQERMKTKNFKAEIYEEP